MQRKGFIAPLVIFTVICAALYFSYTTFSKVVSKDTKRAAETFLKYPNAKNWIVETPKSLCINKPEECSTTAKIIFATNDPWVTIYGYYRNYLPNYGWVTKSQIYLSVPDSVVFTSNLPCEAEIKPYAGIFLTKGNHKNDYQIIIGCKNKQ